MGIEAQPHQVAMLQYHRDFPIKKMEAQLARRKFYEVLTVIIQVYFGADKNTPDSVFSECFDRMVKDYGNISIEEVREAHAESSKNALKAFGGMYTVNMFSEIMYAWKQKRSKILAAIDNIDKVNEVDEAAELESKKQQFTQYCKDWLTNELKIKSIKQWSELSLGICQELIDSGTVKGNRPDLWKQSADLTLKQYEQDRSKASAEKDFATLKKMNAAVEAIMGGIVPQDALSKRKGIYTRLLVFDYLTSNE
jgi:hypothetical protein